MLETFQRRLQRFIQVHVWGMDIHPTARIATTALIDRTWPRGIHIDEGCTINEEVVILTHDRTRGIYLDTRLGPRCNLGPRSIVMPGVEVGADCVIAAGAVVTKNMPPNSYAIGNPAKVVPLEHWLSEVRSVAPMEAGA